jgi:hypothetical protein
MYMSRMLEIGKAENGFVVECRCKIKPAKKTDNKTLCCDYPGSSEKQYIAKDAAEVGKLIERLMPMLQEEYDSEKDFDSAFEAATKEMKPAA